MWNCEKYAQVVFIDALLIKKSFSDCLIPWSSSVGQAHDARLPKLDFSRAPALRYSLQNL